MIPGTGNAVVITRAQLLAYVQPTLSRCRVEAERGGNKVSVKSTVYQIETGGRGGGALPFLWTDPEGPP